MSDSELSQGMLVFGLHLCQLVGTRSRTSTGPSSPSRRSHRKLAQFQQQVRLPSLLPLPLPPLPPHRALSRATGGPSPVALVCIEFRPWLCHAVGIVSDSVLASSYTRAPFSFQIFFLQYSSHRIF